MFSLKVLERRLNPLMELTGLVDLLLKLDEGLLEFGLEALEDIMLPLVFLSEETGVDGLLMPLDVDLRDIVDAGRLRDPPVLIADEPFCLDGGR